MIRASPGAIPCTCDGGGVECGLNHRALRGGDHHLIVFVPKARTDAVGVPGNEGVSRADDAAHHITAVPSLGGFGPARSATSRFWAMRSLISWFSWPLLLEVAEAGLDLFVQEVPHFFEYGDRVGFLFGVLAQTHQDVKELVDIGEVEVACKGQGAAPPVVLAAGKGCTRSMVFRPYVP